MPTAEVCAAAARIVDDVVTRGRSLDAVTARHLSELPLRRHSEARAIAWGTVRWLYRYRPLLHRYLRQPLRRRDGSLEALLLCALYQYHHLDEPDYAVTTGSVEAATRLGRARARGLINAVLRSHLRDSRAALTSDEETCYATPAWLIKRLRHAWPGHWQQVLQSANQHPPMTLRVNVARTDRDSYLRRLAVADIPAQPSNLSPWGVLLERAMPVTKLPGFAEGEVSVQDAAAQVTPFFSGQLAGCRVLDACAAPGGKCSQLLELEPTITSLTALDRPGRVYTIRENLLRLGLNCNVTGGDALVPGNWWDGQAFDLIVLDAPCSGTGVMRRHPDIRVHRRHSDIANYANKQEQLLEALWPLLTPGGRLLYITCSVLPEENDGPLHNLVSRQADARPELVTTAEGLATDLGCQFLPGPYHDGLYYARIRKD
mgnify:FL=1|jgi:16S rRNA (cytosine967-C5)-methyltransferase